MDETLLVNQAQEGDLEAFNLLVLTYQDAAYHLALRILYEPESAEDATQTAFLSAFRHLDHFRGGSFRAWLMRMVCNTCYDELRRRRRRPTVPLEPLNMYDEPYESPEWMIADDPSVEEQAEQSDLQRLVAECLADLPVEFREAVALIDLSGMDYDEAAQAMGKPLGTVKSRLARGRRRLRESLQKRVPDIFDTVHSAFTHPMIHSVEVPTLLR
jgi:RNA polymerase sigma-70 factor (ECF subfamily)